MATYTELFGLRNDSDLRNRIIVACIIAAEGIMAEDAATTGHTQRMAWARQVFANPGNEADRMLMAVLAANNTLSTETIQGASDADIQTAVNNHVNLFAEV